MHKLMLNFQVICVVIAYASRVLGEGIEGLVCRCQRKLDAFIFLQVHVRVSRCDLKLLRWTL